MMEGPRLVCPHCGTALDAEPAPQPQELLCPGCGEVVGIPATDMPETDAAPGDESELDGLRIRQLAAGRRAAYRSRSYCVIAAVVCAVAVVQLSWNGVLLLRATGVTLKPISYFLFAILAAWGAVFFLAKARLLHREARRSALPTTTTSPDFTPLGDGSQRWKNLEDVR